MGFFKKIFKPVSKVLDKIVPNEIKPLLPYAAAFAPMFAPGIMGSSVLSRSLMGGGLNIFGQLAQEGNEGDINMLSAGLGALSGAMSAPGSSPTVGQGVPGAEFTGADFGFEVAGGTPAAGAQSGSQFFKNFAKAAEGEKGILASGQRFLGNTLGKGSDIMRAGINDPFSKAGIKAAALPAATATGDLMFAQAKRDQDAYDDEMAAESEAEGASNAQRAAAIRQSMESYGFTEEEIEDAIYAAGYKTGGRVGFTKGGDVMKAVERGISPDAALDMYKEFKKIKEKYGYEMSFDNYLDGEMFADGGRVGLMTGGLGALGGGTEESESEPETFNFDGSNIQILMPDNNPKIIGESTQGGENMLLIEVNGNTMMISEDAFYDKFGESKAKGGRVGLRFGGIGAAVENIEDTEMKESAKFAMQDMDVPIMELVQEFEIKFKRKPNSLEELKQYYKDKYKGTGDVSMQEEIKEKVVMEAKDGGLMNLGGKEMDMRGGGFIPIGKKERADDVPARLSKNEFVMTADAVRAAGGGSVNEGAKRMYETMNKLEARA